MSLIINGLSISFVNKSNAIQEMWCKQLGQTLSEAQGQPLLKDKYVPAYSQYWCQELMYTLCKLEAKIWDLYGGIPSNSCFLKRLNVDVQNYQRKKYDKGIHKVHWIQRESISENSPSQMKRPNCANQRQS